MAISDLEQLLLAALAAEGAGNWAAAAACYGEAHVLLPGDHRLLTNQGNALWLAGQPEAACTAFSEASALAPQAPVPLRGLGNALRDLNAFEQADHAYDRSLKLEDEALTAWNHSQLLLGLERYGKAFAMAERRHELAAMLPFRAPPYAGPADHPSLRGESSDAPLHLWSEQGFGDTLQYVRWLTVLATLPNAITLEVEHELVTLLEQGLDWLPHPPRVVAKPVDGGAAPALEEAQAPLMSLPHHLGRAPLTSATDGYLRSSDWVRRRASPNRRVGLVWAAGRKLDDPFTAREYYRRSLPSAALALLVEGLDHCQIDLVNLQLGADRDSASELAPRFSSTLDPAADFANTAAAVKQLDLVITVDTAMAHLCGAIGHPAWVLLPYSADPRWLRRRTDSPWYPSLRLWRQTRSGDWIGVVEAVLAAIHQRN
jgi:tetratricopeptide (TPR) repeat protein